jgi:hypothetical protein
VKNSTLEEILMVMLVQLDGGLRWYMRVLDMENRIKREKILNFTIAYDLMVANTFFRKKKITFNYFQHWPALELDRFCPD